MGQKINTNSLQLGTRLAWDSNWCDVNHFFYDNVLKDLDWKHYGKYIIKSLNLLPGNFIIRHVNSKTQIYSKVSNYKYFSPSFSSTRSLNTSLLESSKNLHEKSLLALSPLNSLESLSLYNYKEVDKSKYVRLNLFNRYYLKNRSSAIPFLFAESISDFIVSQMEAPTKKKDLFFRANLLQGLVELTKCLINKSNSTYISGIAIKCKGKWTKTRTGRKQKLTLSVGQITPLGANSIISYGFSTVATKHGACGVKVWVSYKLI